VKLFARLGLRARLAIALVGIAVLAVGLATLLANRGLHPRVSAAAQARLDRSAERFAEVAAQLYRQAGRWQQADLSSLARLSMMNGLASTLSTADGAVIASSAAGSMMMDGQAAPRASSKASASAPILVEGRTVGRVVVSPVQGDLLTPEEVDLQHSLDRLHFVAGAVSAAAALLVAFLLAQTLSSALRRIRTTAQRIEGGELAARVDLAGDPEVRAVGHALNRLAETLEHEEAVRKQTVADLAHELRTPVNGLLTRIEAVQDGVLDPASNLEAMHAEALRLTRLLQDLQKLAEAEQPGLLIQKRRLDLAGVARQESDAFAPRFSEKGIAFEAWLEPVDVVGDDGRLDQVVANLLSNALRYTERGGTVRLAVRPENGHAVLEVADTGIGIPADDLRHIFKRFWRGEKSRSRATGGAGIGLAIVNELVRAHDGRIDVESAPGRGSTFRVTLAGVAAGGVHRNRRSASPDLQTPGRV
jgi:two-component system sensor histidine kinase BaeS